MFRPAQVIRILHLITDLEIGGAEMMLAKLLRRMDSSRFENVVVSLTGRGCLAERIEAAGIPVYSLDMKRARVDFAAFPKLMRLVQEIRPAILQTWLYHADLLGTAAAFFGSRPHLVWNLRCSDMNLTHYPWTTRATLRLLALCSSIPHGIIVNSQTGQRFHQGIGYRAKNWQVIPNGFDLDEFRPDRGAYQAWRDKLEVRHDTILIGMIARVDPMKDHATFLDAARRVVAKHNDVVFVLAGKGTESLGPKVDRSGLSGKLHLLGVRSDIATIMPALDICTLTSAFGEGVPNVLGEAMACGVPCVATDVGDTRALVGETGRIVPPGDPEALARQWLDLIEMGRDKRLELGAAARERIRSGFDLAAVVGRYEQYYVGLAGQAGAVRQGTG